MHKNIVKSVFILMLIAGNTHAQKNENTYSIKSILTKPAAPVSPTVHADKTITFRLKAPSAKQVNLLFGEWDIKPQAMRKDSVGVWSITIGPVAPNIYAYLFSVDGINTLDFANSAIKSGLEIYSNVVEVPGTPARFDEVQEVPHGVLQHLTYTSTALKMRRGLTVFVPAEYALRTNQQFPVLYLRHGGGDNETSWTQSAGKADVILENLLAEKMAEPMIIVMTNGLIDGSWAGGSSKEGMAVLEAELLNEVIPVVERNYRVKPGKNARAIAGLSMGGGQAYIMGLKNLDKFSWIGQFSSGLLSDVDFNLNDRIPGIYSQKEEINKNIKLLWIGCGTLDPRYNGHLAMAEKLKESGIVYEFHSDEGGHEWKVWRNQLHGFLQRLFK